MTYQYVIEKPAMKFLLKQSHDDRERILRAIHKLPGEGDIKPLAGQDGRYRLRVGTFRVIYTIEENILTVRVINIGNRGDIYKK